MKVGNLSWEYRELAKSVYYSTMSDEFKEYAVQRSKELGTAAARQVIHCHGEAFSAADVRRIIAAYHAKVYEDTITNAYDRLSEYDENKRQIVCFIKTIEQKQANMTVVSGNIDLLSLCLAHELFHHLEVVKIGKISKAITLPCCMFGIRYSRSIEAAREIAAHTFVQCLFRLPCSPAELGIC